MPLTPDQIEAAGPWAVLVAVLLGIGLVAGRHTFLWHGDG